MPALLLLLPPSPLLLRNPIHLRNLRLLLLLRIPLARLQHQNSHQHQRQNRITRRQDPQTILTSHNIHTIHVHRPSLPDLTHQPLIRPIRPRSNKPQPLDDIRDIHRDAAHVQHEAGAIKQHVRLGGLVQLHDEAEQAGADDDVQDARDERGRGVQELEVVFEQLEVGFSVWGCGPEHVVVVGEGGEEDADEETGCFEGVRLVERIGGRIGGGGELTADDEEGPERTASCGGFGHRECALGCVCDEEKVVMRSGSGAAAISLLKPDAFVCGERA